MTLRGLIPGVTAVRREALTGDGGGVVGGVSPQVLGGLGGWLGQALRAAAVTHTAGGRKRAERVTMGRQRLTIKAGVAGLVLSLDFG